MPHARSPRAINRRTRLFCHPLLLSGGYGLRKAILAAVVVILVIALGVGVYVQEQLSRPIPNVVAVSSFPATRTVEGQPPSLPWPPVGAAAVAVPNLGVVGTFGERSAHPIASIAKVMTAHVVLSDHPLAAGEQGPSATVTQEDVNIYLQGVSQGESTV